ncbi:hypothetical protein EES40_12675 [Streptomyces sp. ADI93-02]|nr:hypothetical protein EES40_12675 [Streptomyces sp. ADI93-02]
MHQSRDPAVGAVGSGGDHHPGVAVADQRRAGDPMAVEVPHYVVGVRVEMGDAIVAFSSSGRRPVRVRA